MPTDGRVPISRHGHGELPRAHAGARPPSGGPWTELGGRLDGDVLTAQDEGYERAVRPFNGRWLSRRPVAVVRCASTRDVVAALSVARDTRTPLAVRSGGHCFAGLSTTTGVLIDTGPMNGIALEDGRVTVGAGASLGAIYDALAPSSLTIPGGTCPTVGITGLTLGGGLGILGRQHGLTSDRLLAARVVLADGTPLVCDATQHADLFWALRGGGAAGLAVVTSLTFAPVPVPAEAVTVHLGWSAPSAAAVAYAWQRWAPTAPDGFSASLKVTVPADVTEPERVDVYATWFGPERDAERLIAELADVGASPSTVSTATTDYAGARAFWSALGTAPREPEVGSSGPRVDDAPPELFYATSDFVQRPWSRDVVERVLEACTGSRRSGQARELDFMPWGGAYTRRRPVDTAFVHRGDAFLLKQSVTLAAGADDDEREEASRQLARMRAAVRPVSTGRSFQNFADPDDPSWAEAHYGENLGRLARVRARYDPTGVFRHAQSLAGPAR